MRIGILGATGAVGRQMLDCLIEQEIPVDDLVLLASKKVLVKSLSLRARIIWLERLIMILLKDWMWY